MTAMPVGVLRDAVTQAISPAGAPAMTWPAEAVSAELIACNGRDAQITRDGVVCAARVAFGCLVQPEPGDVVLAGLADGTIWILSVLERNSQAPSRLWTEGDLRIVSAGGDISLDAGRSVDIAARTKILAAAMEIDLHAGIARFVLDELVQIGRKVSWHVSRLRSMGDVIETFAEHVLTRARRSSRFIEESDQKRAGAIDHRAAGVLQLHADVAFVTADTVVRVDADQIHMG